MSNPVFKIFKTIIDFKDNSRACVFHNKLHYCHGGFINFEFEITENEEIDNKYSIISYSSDTVKSVMLVQFFLTQDQLDEKFDYMLAVFDGKLTESS